MHELAITQSILDIARKVADEHGATRVKSVKIMLGEYSGVDMDVRRDAPYSSYEDFEFNVPVQNSCDVYARVVVRVLEIYESMKIIRQAVDTLPEGPINLGNKIPKVPAGQFIARHEAPRGHLVYKVVTNGGQENHRLSLHVPTFKNAPTVPVMLRGNTVADAGLIVASIDPCFSCLDR